MKHIRFLLLMVFFVTSCQTAIPLPTATPQSTATAVPTSTPSPVPTTTKRLESTVTPAPSPTPILLPVMIHQMFSDVSIIHHDSFEFIMQGMAPQGWESAEQYAIWVTEDGQLKAEPLDHGTWSGTVFYYTGEKIIPNRGVTFLFKYTGTAEGFSLGFDNINPNGEFIRGDNFHSISLNMLDRDIKLYGIQKRNQIRGSFKGNLSVQEDVWYNIVLAQDKDHNFIIRLWDPHTPEKHLTYFRNWQEFPTAYYFISFISSKRTLLLDDFIVFKFDEIIQE